MRNPSKTSLKTSLFFQLFSTKVFLLFSLIFIFQSTAYSACGGTVRTWQGTSVTWNTTTNWSGTNVPNAATEDVVMRSTGFNPSFATSYLLGCVDVQAGTIDGITAGITMTITGDYFSAPIQNSLNFTNNTFTVSMAGAAAQTFEAVDDIRGLSIDNRTTVTLKNDFRVLRTMTLVGTGTTIVEGTLRLSQALTIPAGHKVLIKNGGAIHSTLNVTVNGELEIEGGGELRMANARTLSVTAGGALKITGSSGNPAVISSLNSSSWFTFTVAGSVTANYAQIKRVTTNGMNVTGAIIQLDNTDFRGMVTSGYGLTLGAAAVTPSTFNTIGFYNDDNVATPRNINANTYNLTAIVVSNTSGSVAGTAFELDPNNKISWPSTAPVQLAISDDAEANEPTATLAVSTAVTFAEFAFTLNQTSTATDITQITFTMTGTATMSDLSYVRAYRDANADCNYDVGDTQIGSDLIFSGVPLKATVNIAAGQVTTNSSTQQACVHIVAAAAAMPVDQRTVSFSIASSADVVNSQSYAISGTSGTPLNSASTILINNTYSQWDGSSSTAWNTAANWNPATLPSATRDCKIGLATNTTIVNANPVRCANATLQTNGTLNFNNTTNVFEVSNSLDVGTGFIFTNAATGVITMRGTVSQTMSLQTAFPGNVIINNTGVTNKTVTIGANSTINGNLTCTAGILSIPNGVTLTVLGSITVQTGCTLEVSAGGTLKMANNRTLTVDTGGTLQVIGSAGSKATVTSNAGAAAYNVVVNGTIKARYYTFDHLNTTGVSIETGATIDPTNYMQDGTFSYPVNSTSTLLRLKKQVPGNALSNMVFTKNSSAATTIVNIDSTTAAAGTLTVTNFSGDVSGEAYDTDPTYAVTWTGELNTITISQEATSPTPVNTSGTYNMGRFGFRQVEAGSSFLDADITTLSLSLTGTGSATDVSAARLYSNATCTGTGGTLIGTGTFSGSPSKITFTITAGALVVPASLTAPALVCAYVEFDIASSATNGNTVGVKINSSSDFVNNKTYAASVSTTFPVTLGTSSTINAPTTTTWTGTTSTAWAVGTNWTAGVPTSAMNCTIPNTANDPIISVGTATCKSLTITNGILVINAGMFLDIYGDLSKVGGTLTINGSLSIKDGGANINHSLSSNTALTNLILAKTGTGTVTIDQASLSITTLTFSSATTTLEIPSGNKLVLPSGVNITQGRLKILGGGTLEVGNAQTITVSGGMFWILGTNDAFPQSLATKGIVQVTGGGTNSYNFTATSGVVNLSGFQFDRLGVNGLNVGGTTAVTTLRGGQFTNLSTTYASVKVIQLNNSGGVPASAANIGWVWGDWNSFNPANVNTPTSAQGYKLITSTGCANGTIDFTGWSGDWFESQPTFNVTTKTTSVATCTINMGAAASAVSILYFNAVPFNSAIDLRWRTNSERNHLGFNVYRADLFSAQFQQINRQLIRNVKSSGSNQASYRFVDNDVENGQRYYYYIEDVEIGGRRVFHGPVFATPMSTLGAPPANNADENTDSNSDDADDGGTTSPAPIPNPTYEDLGNGVVILSKTSKSLRIEIIPPAPVFSASTWNGSYQDVRMDGYSKMTLVGSPELPEKDLMIEVQSFAQTTDITNQVVTETTLAGHLISPAPSYSINGSGVLIPAYAINNTRYSNSTNYPANYFSLDATLVTINKSKFLKLKINPLKLNPVTQSIQMATKIVLDIGLDGDDWNVDAPTVNSQIGPYSVSNTLKINYTQTGVHELAYEDFVAADVEGPFKNSNLSAWRLYYKNLEIPLEIISANGSFDAGDKIRFYASYIKGLESHFNQLILSPVDLKAAVDAPKRMVNIDVDPGLESETNETLIQFTKTYEQNLKYIDGVTLDDGLDHFFYADLVNFPGMDTLSVAAALPEIDLLNSVNVLVKVHLKGRLGVFGLPVKHHLQLLVQGASEGEVEFEDNDRKVVTFEVPADRFAAGNNNIQLKTLGTYAPATDYDFILIDKVEIVYGGFSSSASGVNNFSLMDSLRVHTLTNFTSSLIEGYDVTNPLAPLKLINTSIGTLNGGVSHHVKFFVDDEVDSENLKHYSFSNTGAFIKPTNLSLNQGIDESLKNSSNRADLIIYGKANLLEAAGDLISRRTSQGLDVMTITPEQVYGEFSFGVQSSKALKDFLQTARSTWSKPPRFLLILGDGTFDPLDYNVSGLANNERSVLEVGTLPAPLIAGRFIDFSSDNYFVSSEQSHLPELAVGRLPTNDPDKIKAYVDKLQRYEDGASAPSSLLRRITYFADQETGDYERFNELSVAMMGFTTNFTQTLYDRTELGSLASTKAKINEEFAAGPLLISLMGHGAFDRFGDNLFNVTDAAALSNSVYPVVANWNCESAYFYDADKTMKSLAEALIFNPEGGAIVYLGSTTQTTPPAQARLAQNFLNQFSTSANKPYDGTRLGEILSRAKISVGSGSYEKDIINSFSIIGDPSLKLPSALYPAAPNQPSAAAPAKKQKGFLGCSAFAGEQTETTWHEGLPEFIFYLLLMGFGARRFARIVKN